MKKILTPQKHTEMYSKKMDEERKRQKMYKCFINVKTRRHEIKFERSTKAKSDEIKEGTSYESFCGFDSSDLDILDMPSMITKATDDLEKKNINMEKMRRYYSCYFLPDGDIDPKASNVNSLTVKRDRNGNRYLCKNGRDMHAGTISDGWISSLDKKNIVLAAHNGKSFDNRILLKYLIKFKILAKFRELVFGFTDTLTILRKEIPCLKSYSVQNLYETFSADTFNAHDAEADIVALAAVLAHFHITEKDNFEFRFDQRNEGKLCTETSSITPYMANKIANRGLSYEHLQLAHNRNSECGISLLLSENQNNKARVTKNKAMINKIKQHFTALII
ncbi:hypothetical protein MAR_036519 [Mya arenaria]|uniref:Exonuclease domain-containing protein n=1 Tax=Mya arenaria TaxID=6604 RepID=A0ABY7FKX4_MYAAR|nr:hypothetical protein MAR_036519 [Mya arenaria]